MTEWITVDPARYNVPSRQKRNGVELRVSLSPYDIPEQVRGWYDEIRKRLVIEFSYITNEKWLLKQENNLIALRVGEHSGRLYGIEVNTDAAKAQSVSLTMQASKIVNKAIVAFSSESPHRTRRANYDIARNVISERQQQLFKSLADVSG